MPTPDGSWVTALEGTVSAARPRRDVYQMTRLTNLNTMPYTFWHHDRFAWVQCLDMFLACVRLVAAGLQDYVNATRYEVEQFVTIGVQFTAVGCIPCHARRTHRKPVDTDGFPRPGLHDF